MSYNDFSLLTRDRVKLSERCTPTACYETIFNDIVSSRTMLQVLNPALSKTCNMLQQRNVALKVARCAILYDIDF